MPSPRKIRDTQLLKWIDRGGTRNQTVCAPNPNPKITREGTHLSSEFAPTKSKFKITPTLLPQKVTKVRKLRK